MSCKQWLAAFALPALIINAPQVTADTVPIWVTDTMASVDVFTGTPEPLHVSRFSDVESHVDALYAKGDAIADIGYATAFAEAQGSLGPALFYTTHASSRADAELNDLASGRYRVSFAFTVLSMGPGTLAGNEAAVGYQYGNITVELKGTASGIYTADIDLNDGTGPDDNWIAFFAWSDSHAMQGTVSGNATLSDALVTRLPDQPHLPTPLPAGLWLFVPALAMLAGVRRRAA